MRTRTIAATAIAGLALTLTACSSDSEPTASSKTTSAPAEDASTPTPSETAPAEPRAIGQTLTWTGDGITFDTTVMGYEQGVAKNSVDPNEEFDTDGYVWASVDIKSCLKKGNAGVTRYPWALAYADGARIEPSGVTYDDFPKPEYPYEAKMKEGECVRGKTVFAVPGDQRPERILYTADSLPEVAEWAVPKE